MEETGLWNYFYFHATQCIAFFDACHFRMYLKMHVPISHNELLEVSAMKSIKKLFLLLSLILCLGGFLPADTPVLPQPQTVRAASAKISKKTLALSKGKTAVLKITGTKSKVTWSSSNNKVAVVSQKGKVTAKKAGTATITAKAGKKRFKCKVTVKSPSASAPSTYVWLSATGSKYHKIPDCGTMNPDKARKVSKSVAAKAGFDPCKKCFR